MSKGKRQQPIPQPRHQPLKNRAWDELNELSDETTRLLHSTIGGARDVIVSAMANPEIDPVERNALVNLIGSDSKKITDRLTALRTLHVNRTGDAVDSDALVETLNLGGQYGELMSDINLTVLANTARLTEMQLPPEAPETEPSAPAPDPSNTEA